MKTSPLSKRLKEARIEAGMSQKQLGIAAGIDQFVASARMNQYEMGKHAPEFTMLQKISDALGTPKAYFYATDDELAKLIKAYEKLSRSEKQRIMAFFPITK